MNLMRYVAIPLASKPTEGSVALKRSLRRKSDASGKVPSADYLPDEGYLNRGTTMVSRKKECSSIDRVVEVPVVIEKDSLADRMIEISVVIEKDPAADRMIEIPVVIKKDPAADRVIEVAMMFRQGPVGRT